MSEKIIIFSTASSEEEALNISKNIVESRLAACANILPAIQSIYWWKDKIHDEKEVLIIIKTVKDKLDDIIKKIEELHSYEVPEIIAVPVAGGSEKYLNWINREVK
jgi:periplasmic divalent cation tolerance protein